MIYEAIIILAILGIFIIIARKMPNTQGLQINNDNHTKKFAKDNESKKIPTSLLDQAEYYFNSKDYAKAEELYIKLASVNPEDYKIYNRLGIIYLEQKNYADAKDAFEATIKLGGAKAGRYYNLALAYTGLQELRNASEATQKALELNNDNQKYLDLQLDLNKRLKKYKKC